MAKFNKIKKRPTEKEVKTYLNALSILNQSALRRQSENSTPPLPPTGLKK